MTFLTRKHVPSSILMALLCACTGCGPSHPRIEGTVTLDGVPVDGGSISFFQGSGAGSDKGNAPIVGGKYVIGGDRARNLAPGSYTVRIFWLQLLGNSNPKYVDASAPVKQLIPEQYNDKSTLTREVKPGTNQLDFDLQSK
jgi:hypothetical protein